MENADRAVDRFRRPVVVFVGLVNDQTRDVPIVNEPNDWIGKQFTVVLCNDQSASVASDESNSQPLRRRSRKTDKAQLDLHGMIFGIASWINGLEDDKQLPKAPWRFEAKSRCVQRCLIEQLRSGITFDMV